MNWDDRESKLDEKTETNKIRHSMECPNCRSNTWSFCCFVPDFKKGDIKEGCNECDQDAKRIWDREKHLGSGVTGIIALGGSFVIGILLGWFLL